MKSRPGLLFTFNDGREIALPCPTAERMAAVFALAPAPGTPETGAQFIARFTRQVDTMLESARWIATPATERRALGITPGITAATLSLSQARILSNAVLAHYMGAETQIFTRGMEALAATAGRPELQSVPLGELLRILSR